MKSAITILGLNSGTSADGLDMAAIRFSPGRFGATIDYVHGASVRYPHDLHNLIERMAGDETTSLENVIFLDNVLGQFYGEAAARFIRSLGKRKITVDAIASHGQTVRHVPRKIKHGRFVANGSMQLGSLERIAAATGKVTTGDFRQADVALGNEGAPITVAAMARLFADPHQSRLIVNIGGIANFFYFPANEVKSGILAADTGPGNSLCDLLAARLFHRPYDKGGRLALSGTVSARLLAELQASAFHKKTSASTGREEFGWAMTDRIQRLSRKLRLDPHDIVATVAELTVTGISRAILRIVRRDGSLRKLYLTGGGAHNDYFRRRLVNHLPTLQVSTVAELGIEPDLVEASAYAVMGYACLRSEPLQTVFRDGKKQTRFPILGKIVQPPVTVKR
jgi:anhydro-N-acetylmuramic acid kinase